MIPDTDASNFIPRLETSNAELRAQLAVAQEYLARLERVATENIATYRQQGEMCDTLRADIETERRKRFHAVDRIAALRECLVEDAAAMEDLREDWENAESWAQYYQKQAERKAAKVKRLKKQTTGLVAEMERLGRELNEARALAQNHAALADTMRANFDDAMCALHKAQTDLTDLNEAWRADRAAYLRLDGAGPEYVTTDADGRVTHYGRGRTPVVQAEPLICTGDERLAYADRINEATDLTNRETDAALQRLYAQKGISQ